MIELRAPSEIVLGQPFEVSFSAEERVAGRLRITAGKDEVPFVLERVDREPVRAARHRVRGRSGEFVIRDWGEHPPGAELVLRFELPAGSYATSVLRELVTVDSGTISKRA